MDEFALAVPFPGLVELVGIANNLPPHVTVLVPCPGDVTAIADALAPFDAFDVTFARLERFPGLVWLAPEPAAPFVGMTEAMVERFPDYRPYGGIHDAIVPHLTLAQERLDETAASVESRLPLRGRAESVVLYRRVSGDHWAETTTFSL